MIGLKRGSVALLSHQEEWNKNAENVILELKQLFGNAAVDIQHVGSTAIASIYAKPIIDIVIGLRDLDDISRYMKLLKEHGFVFRGEDVAGQMLFVMGDFEKETRTHHIHAVKWNGTEWNNYINFRDYLNCHPDKATLYDTCKKKLALQFPDDRRNYTEGKRECIECLLKEAYVWRQRQDTYSGQGADKGGKK
ncbi:GrpB family protein [Parablautia muri]|uniref:GrpB family protein n=1 Tax=Parablautia muri TaxID=2320879 RepID=A0A9X5GRU8_9FIRM|nr:GrpB family protein [Parablautia muri]NBJ93548.1 GrpB family protein [Parablautia muri]